MLLFLTFRLDDSLEPRTRAFIFDFKPCFWTIMRGWGKDISSFRSVSSFTYIGFFSCLPWVQPRIRIIKMLLVESSLTDQWSEVFLRKLRIFSFSNHLFPLIGTTILTRILDHCEPWCLCEAYCSYFSWCKTVLRVIILVTSLCRWDLTTNILCRSFDISTSLRNINIGNKHMYFFTVPNILGSICTSN